VLTAPTHASVVHPLESLHCAAVVHPPETTLLQVPPGAPAQVSVVDALPSLQFAPVSQQPGAGEYQLEQAPARQASPVQPLLSVQALVSSFGCRQLPPPHTSSVHELPSSAHGDVLLPYTQPVATLQESSVQTLPSLQLKGAPATHCPESLQVSPIVQALASLHDPPVGTGACSHPAAPHVSTVHGFASSQFNGVPATHPVDVLQVSLPLQTSPSSHTTGAEPVQLPLSHVSPMVQALPSLQGATLKS